MYKSKPNVPIHAVIDSWGTSEFLKEAELTFDGKITNTTILLIGNSNSHTFLKDTSARISWILKDKNGKHIGHELYYQPLVTSVDLIFKNIRNVTYKYLTDDSSLLPKEVDRYDPWIIREALHNCIAHRDYSLNGYIQVVEYEHCFLCFTNPGSFNATPNILKLLNATTPKTDYRNPFLVKAMINLNMIETIGSGIPTMFDIQKDKYFPLPEYEFNEDETKLTIYGMELDNTYTLKLAQNPNLTYEEILSLDEAQKKKYKAKETDHAELEYGRIVTTETKEHRFSNETAHAPLETAHAPLETAHAPLETAHAPLEIMHLIHESNIGFNLYLNQTRKSKIEGRQDMIVKLCSVSNLSTKEIIGLLNLSRRTINPIITHLVKEGRLFPSKKAKDNDQAYSSLKPVEDHDN